MQRPIGQRLIAFLRAINVGGHTVTMAQLRKEFEALKLQDVETFIASGNVVFRSRAKDVAALERKIEARLRASLGYDVDTFIRTDAVVAAIAAYTPFTEAKIRGARAFCVGFIRAPLDAAGARALATFKNDNDDFHTNGREVYWLCKTGQGDSAFNNGTFEKSLKIRSTFRGMNTIVRLAAKYEPS